MKNKGALVLIEQAVMLLVFALAAVLCLRAFVWADTTSKEITARDGALIQAQNAAEVLKSCAGDGEIAAQLYGGAWDGQVWTVHYNGHWEQVEKSNEYLLVGIPIHAAQEGIGTAIVRVFRGEDCLVRWENHVAWQEVTDGE